MYFLGERIRLNFHKLSTKPPGADQGSLSRLVRLKEEKSCFYFSVLGLMWVLKLSSVDSTLLYRDTRGKSLSTLLFSTECDYELISVVCQYISQLILFHILSFDFHEAILLLQTCLCTCATHIQMMNRSECERAPLLWTRDTSLPHIFIANQCRWHHFLHTVTGDQWELCHAFYLSVVINEGGAIICVSWSLHLVINNKACWGMTCVHHTGVHDDR